MVEESGADWLGCSVIVDQLGQYRQDAVGTVWALLSAPDLPPDRL